MSRPRRCGEEGYATIAAAGIIVAIVSLLLIVAAVGSRVAARHEAQVAADLAAVAGAWASLRVKMLAPPRAIPPRLTTPP